MNDSNPNRTSSYFNELTICLHRERFTVLPQVEQTLPVSIDGQQLCKVTGDGGTRYRKEDLYTPDLEAAYDRVLKIVEDTAEYMSLMVSAPKLTANGLEGDYRILSEFNGIVLAGHPTQFGVQFVTWSWDVARTSLYHGHYAAHDYDTAKRDFAVRSGLVKENHLLTNEQLAEVYRCIHETLDSEYVLSDKRQEALWKLSEQIERCVSNLEELVHESNKQELDLTM